MGRPQPTPGGGGFPQKKSAPAVARNPIADLLTGQVPIAQLAEHANKNYGKSIDDCIRFCQEAMEVADVDAGKHDVKPAEMERRQYRAAAGLNGLWSFAEANFRTPNYVIGLISQAWARGITGKLLSFCAVLIKEIPAQHAGGWPSEQLAKNLVAGGLAGKLTLDSIKKWDAIDIKMIRSTLPLVIPLLTMSLALRPLANDVFGKIREVVISGDGSTEARKLCVTLLEQRHAIV